MNRTRNLISAAGLIAAAGLVTSANAAVINIPDALGQTGDFNVQTDIDDITGEESVYLVGTMEISNTSGEYLSGNLYLEISTSAPAGGGAQRLGIGNVVNSNDWGINGSPGNLTSGVDVELDTPTTMVAKINQTTGDWSFWLSPDLGAPEPGSADLSGNTANLTDGIGFIRLRGGRYGSIPVNTNVTDFTDVALYTGSDTPFIPEPSSLALLGLGGLIMARRRRG